MFVRRFFDDRLAQASYLIGCQRTGEAIVIDPSRDITAYLDTARAEQLRITRVTETHIHADFLSGARELVSATGARALLSGEGGREWQYGWAEADGADLLHHGDRIVMGGVELLVRHTPGHTPEHIAFIVTDAARSPLPVAMVSGDFLFVGDVGRPDLLEKAAHQTGTMTESARQLYRSLQALTDLPDHLQIWPGHGAGSACGKALGAMPSSTLGYERASNWAFAMHDESAFVDAVLDGQPTPPAYFAVMKRLNRAGPPVLGNRAALPLLLADTIATTLERATVIDIRSAAAFAAGHVRGSISIPLIKAFPTWAGWFVSYEKPLVLIAEGAAQAEQARTTLASIGLDDVIGYYDATAVAAAAPRGLQASGTHGDVLDAPRYQAEGRTVIDIRADSEWNAGHIPGAEHHLLGTIEQSMAGVARDTPVAIHCQGGTRSGIGASILERMGFTDVVDLKGGYGAWKKQ